jgi:AcrR family transcriptional regulator
VETRERIYRAALALFAERGFMETTVEDITETADVGKGTFFNYFPTKEHVLATYGAERLATVERALQEARRGNRPVMEVLRELAASVAGQATASPGLVRAIYAAHASCDAVRDELQTRMQTARRLLAQIFRLAQERGEVRTDMPAAILSRLVQTVFHGVMASWALNPSGTLRGTAEEVWSLLWPGLRVSGHAGGGNRSGKPRE